MTNINDSLVNVSTNVTNVIASYPIKPDYIRYVLVITLLFVGLGLLLVFFSKFNQLLSKKVK